MKKLLIILFLLVSNLLVGQNTDKKKHPLHETINDAYLPNAYNNTNVSPAYKYKSTPVSKKMSSSIFTTQVNVNGSGQNILGDAANEPNMAVNPLNPNEITIGWRQFDNVLSDFRQAGWSYSTDAGQTWSFSGAIQSGIFNSDPVLDYDADGNFYYNTLGDGYPHTVFTSTNGGANWNNGVSAGAGDKQWMTVDRTSGLGSGNVYKTSPPGWFDRSRNASIMFENSIAINADPYWGTLTVGIAGEVYGFGGVYTGISPIYVTDTFVVAKTLNANITLSTIIWEPPVPVFMDGHMKYGSVVNPIGLLGQAYIDVDHSNGPGQGNVYVLASVVRLSIPDSCDVMFAKSTDGGLTWSAPLQINDDSSVTNTQWFGTMSVAPNGRIDAIWLDTRDAPLGSDSSALYYSYSINQGTTWSANEKMSASFDPHIGYPNQDKMGDYFDMVSDNTGAHVAWANTFNGEEDVYYSYIIPPIVLGVNEIAIKELINIYPNPSSTQFTIEGLTNLYNLTIYNTVGQILYAENNVLPSSKRIDVRQYAKGLLFIRVESADEVYYHKLIKE